MSDEEFYFYYFIFYDYDQNKKLDGFEILYGINDYLNGMDEYFVYNIEEEGVLVVDNILRRMDENFDGYIDYLEYIKVLIVYYEYENFYFQ